MIDHNDNSSGPRPYETAFLWKKRYVFAVTSLVVMLMLSLIVSSSIREYSTSSVIEMSVVGNDPNLLCRRLVDAEIADSGLSRHVQTAKENTGLLINHAINRADLDTIRNDLVFDLENVGSRRWRLAIRMRGAGTDCERSLTGSIADSLAGKLTTENLARETYQQLESSFTSLRENLQQLSGQRHRELVSANRSVEQLDAGLSDIYQQLESLSPFDVPNDQLASDNPIDPESQAAELARILDALESRLRDMDEIQSGEEFARLSESVDDVRTQLDRIEPEKTRLRSSAGETPLRVVNTELPRRSAVAAGLLESVEGLDTDSLRAKISQVQQNLRTDTNQILSQIKETQRLAGELANNRIVLQSVHAPKTTPAKPLPGLSTMFLLACVSVGAGIAGAVWYQPALTGVGFENFEQLGRRLKLPVIARINPESEKESVANEDQGPFTSNAVFQVCEIVLFTFAALLVVLCILQPEVRIAFLENPLLGLAKLAELVMGP